MLRGKAVIVTGASQGIGKGLALAVASAGASVLVTARSLDAAKIVVEEIRNRGGRAIPCRCDVTDRGAVEAAVASAIDNFGRLDGLVHNAISRLSGTGILLQDVPDENWDEQLAVGMRAAFYCAQAGFVELRKSRGSYVVLVSNGGIEGSLSRPVYSAVKGAQRGLVKSLAREWGPHGVRVNAIAPVAMTPTMSTAFETQPELKQYIEFGSALGRIGDSELDIGGALNFLLGPGSAFITGQTLLVNGGTTML